jgi:glycosyltransferase involved in cell wall biosynthesis
VVRDVSLIRVGFRPPGKNWQGGRNYLWNLLHAIGQLERPSIAPVVVPRIPEDITDYRSVAEVLPLSRVASRTGYFVGRATLHLAGLDIVERYEMARANVALYSHAPPLGKRFGIPWLYWIPDMQIVRLPQQFSRFGRLKYLSEMRAALDRARLLVVSSHVAKHDVIDTFGARYESKIRVLQFVAQPRTIAHASSETLVQRYRIPPRYIALPNQFWKHKNHEVVIDALVNVPDVTIVATGATEDFRHPDHFAALMARARSRGVENRFRVLGAIPFADVIGLIAGAVAVINPSLFEGWSTTVEEARSLGKRLVLSDIPVHREQNPPRARYFPATDASALAGVLATTWHESNTGDVEAAALAAESLVVRTRAFAATYEAIAREAIDAALA